MLDTGKYHHKVTEVIKRYVLTYLCLLGGLGCSQGPNSTSEEVDWSIPIVSEDILIDRLAPHLLAEVEDTSQHNMLIDHICDQNWDMQYHTPGIFAAILSTGSGEYPKWGDRVSVHYNGYKLDATLFDSSFKKKRPFSFYIGNVIKGWNAALPLLDVGGRGVFIIPHDLAYGEEGFLSLVGPNEHLFFEIELLEIEHRETE